MTNISLTFNNFRISSAAEAVQCQPEEHSSDQLPVLARHEAALRHRYRLFAALAHLLRVILLDCCIVVLLYCCFVVLLYCFIVLLFYCFIVLLFYYVIVDLHLFAAFALLLLEGGRAARRGG